MPRSNDETMWDSIGGEARGDPWAELGDEAEVRWEAWKLSRQMTELRVRRRFVELDGDTNKVEEIGRKIAALKARRRSLFVGREEPKESLYEIRSLESDFLEDERDRILDQIGARIRECRIAKANGDTVRASELDKEIIALRARQESVHTLFYGSTFIGSGEEDADGPR